VTQYNTKPTLETWYDIVKRVMRLKSKMGKGGTAKGEKETGGK
jgi:hypothetical protein